MKNNRFFFIFAFLLTLSSLSFPGRAQDTLRLMSFNIWQEGTSVTNGLEKIRDVIIAVDPDVVCFAEVRNYNGQDWTTKILDALAVEGHSYNGKFYGGDVSLISKFPILSGTVVYNGTGSVVNYRLQTDHTDLLVGCAHLDYTYYACYLPRGYNGGDPNWNMIDDGTGNPAPVTDVNTILSYNLRGTRDEQIAAFLDAVKDDTIPVFLMGDFNEPSWRDWTEKTDTMFDHHGTIIPWQNTKTLSDNGFTDAFREFFPDEVSNPGITWPSFATGKGSTSWTPKADERDRIDYIFYKGQQIGVADAALVGPRVSYAYNVVDTSYTSHEHFLAEDLPWPSDHKAVYAEITIGDNTSGIRPANNSAFCSVSPNPAGESLHISLDHRHNRVSVEIYTLGGKKIFGKTFAGTRSATISVSGIHKGLHLVRIRAGGKSEIVKTMIGQ